MEHLRFVVSLHTRDNDFQLAQAAAADETARRLGVQVEIIFADNDAVNQSTQLLNRIQQRPESRPSAIILESVSGTALPQVARAACTAGIAWVVLNRKPEYVPELRRGARRPVFAMTSDNTDIGRIQGRQFAALLPKGGTILYIEGPSQSSSAQKRTAGMLETKPANIHLVTLRGQWTEESAERAVESWLKLATSRTAAISLIAAQDDPMTLGARKAFSKIKDERERAHWLGLPYTGCDGLPESGHKWVRDGWLAATIHIPPLAGKAMELCAKAIHDGLQPSEHSIMPSHSIPPLEQLNCRWR